MILPSKSGGSNKTVTKYSQQFQMSGTNATYCTINLPTGLTLWENVFWTITQALQYSVASDNQIQFETSYNTETGDLTILVKHHGGLYYLWIDFYVIQ